jgi:hypothetical protein
MDPLGSPFGQGFNNLMGSDEHKLLSSGDIPLFDVNSLMGRCYYA